MLKCPYDFAHRARALRSATSSGSAVSPAATVGAGNSDESSGLYLKQFVYSKAAQYRKLKMEWKTNVFLGRSNIQVSFKFSWGFFFLIWHSYRVLTWHLSIFIIWRACWAGNMNQILRCDWLPERAGWSYLARWGLRAVSRKKNFFFPCNVFHIRSIWLDISLVFCVFSDLNSFTVHKHEGKPTWSVCSNLDLRPGQ